MRVDMGAVNFLGIKLRMYSLRRLMGNFKNRAQEREQAQYLYICSVQQARESKFYTICGVADTLDGRFDLIVLHVHLLSRALRLAGTSGTRISDLIFKIMMDDMDMNLREMGVGDLSVGKKVKAMARAFYGRAAAYDRALDTDTANLSNVRGESANALREGLEDVVNRNIFGLEPPKPVQVTLLASYIREVDRSLREIGKETLLSGKISFSEIPEQ